MIKKFFESLTKREQKMFRIYLECQLRMERRALRNLSYGDRTDAVSLSYRRKYKDYLGEKLKWLASTRGANNV